MNQYIKTNVMVVIFLLATSTVAEGSVISHFPKNIITEQIITPISDKYNSAWALNEELICVGEDTDGDGVANQYGLINTYGKEILSPQYSMISEYSSGLARVYDFEHKVGFIDTEGKIAIPFGYEHIQSFLSNELSIASNGNGIGLIDKKGNEVSPFIYNSIGYFYDGLASVSKESKYGFINEKGQEVIPTIYDYTGSFSGGVVFVKKGDDCFLIDDTGAEVAFLPQSYFVTHFFNGLAKVGQDTDGDGLSDKYGFIDTSGNIAVPLIYNDVTGFSEGLSKVTVAGYSGFVNKFGNEVIPPIYSRVESFSEGYAKVGKDLNNDLNADTFGYIDTKGNEVIPISFSDARSFSEDGLACVKKDDKWGYIDKEGNTAIPFIYDSARDFSNGFAHVGISTEKDLTLKYGIIDVEGNEIVPLEYDFIDRYYDEFSDDLQDDTPGYYFELGKDIDGDNKVDVFGIVDEQGEYVVPLEYDVIGTLTDNVSILENDGKLFILLMPNT